MRYFASNKFSYGKGMTMASERLGNIEDLSYKDDISLFSQIGEYSQMQPFRVSLSEDEISLFMQYYALLGSKITHSSCRHQDAVMQASEVINRCIIDDVRRLLHNSDKSVKEISNELGFPNLSFFGKYVKRMLGMSPKAYRKSLGVIAGE